MRGRWRLQGVRARPGRLARQVGGYARRRRGCGAVEGCACWPGALPGAAAAGHVEGQSREGGRCERGGGAQWRGMVNAGG